VQETLLAYAMTKIQDGVSYFIVEYDSQKRIETIYIYDGSTHRHRKFPFTWNTSSVQVGPMEAWTP